MSRTRELAAGGRVVEVEPERLAGFLERFAAGHGGALTTTVEPRRVDVAADDGWTASIPVPFGPLAAQPGKHAVLVLDDLLDHLVVPHGQPAGARSLRYGWAVTAAFRPAPGASGASGAARCGR